MPAEHLARFAELDRTAIDLVRERGFHVLGDLSALAPEQSVRPGGREPGTVSAAELVESAARLVADVLAERGIPFLFTTGFDAATIVPERFRGTTVLGKPYGTDDIHLCIVALLRDRPPAGEPMG